MNRYNWIYRICQHFSYGALNSIFYLDTDGLENIPLDGGFIIACNHASYIDPPLAGSVLPRELFYFARKTLFKPGFAKILLDQLNTIPVDRDGDSDISALRKTIKHLHEGEGVVLFPEGTRTQNGQMGQGKAGIGFIACKAGVPIIPTLLTGTYNALKNGKIIPSWGQSIHIVFGKPLMPEDYDTKAKDKDRYINASNCVMQALQSLTPPLYKD